MEKKILILGAYGGFGKAMARILLQHTNAQLTLAGRSMEKLEQTQAELGRLFRGRVLDVAWADATNYSSLEQAFHEIDLVIVATTTPDAMPIIAKAALASHTDLVDIFVRGDVVQLLEPFQEQITHQNCRVITQAGFHPGLGAPSLRLAKTHFDEMPEARIFMAMDPVFFTPESVNELIYELVKGHTELLEEGKWRKVTYRDIRSARFSSSFGKKACYPFHLREVLALPEELGWRNGGVYAAGFSWFIDNIVFPLAMILGWISLPLAQKVAGNLMYWARRKDLPLGPRVEFLLHAEGTQNGQKQEYQLRIFSDDGYALTAQCVLAALWQMETGSLSGPGLYIMGADSNALELFSDLRDIGLDIRENQSLCSPSLTP